MFQIQESGPEGNKEKTDPTDDGDSSGFSETKLGSNNSSFANGNVAQISFPRFRYTRKKSPMFQRNVVL